MILERVGGSLLHLDGSSGSHSTIDISKLVYVNQLICAVKLFDYITKQIQYGNDTSRIPFQVNLDISISIDDRMMHVPRLSALRKADTFNMTYYVIPSRCLYCNDDMALKLSEYLPRGQTLIPAFPAIPSYQDTIVGRS